MASFLNFVLSLVRSTTVVIMQFKILRPEGYIFSALVYDQLQFLNLKSYTEITVTSAQSSTFRVPANS